MKKYLMTLAAVLCCAAVYTSCNKVDPEPEILAFAPLLQWGCSIAGGKTEALYNTDEDGYSQAIYRPVGK